MKTLDKDYYKATISNFKDGIIIDYTEDKDRILSRTRRFGNHLSTTKV